MTKFISLLFWYALDWVYKQFSKNLKTTYVDTYSDIVNK